MLMRSFQLMLLSSEAVITFPHLPTSCQRRPPSVKKSIMRRCNLMLEEIQLTWPIRGPTFRIAKKKISSALIGIFTKEGLRGILEGADYRSVDYIFIFIAESIYRYMGRVEEHEQTTVHTLYAGFMVGITGGNKRKPRQHSMPENIQEKVNDLK